MATVPLESPIALYHAEIFPPRIVDPSLLGTSAEGLGDEATQIPTPPGLVEIPGAVYFATPEIHARRTLPIVELVKLGIPLLLPESEGSGLWRRYVVGDMDRAGCVTFTLAKGWTAFGRVSVDPSLSLHQIQQGTGFSFSELEVALCALEFAGRVTRPRELHGIPRFLYVPELSAEQTQVVDGLVTSGKTRYNLTPDEARGLRAGLAAYAGIMGENFDPCRHVGFLPIDELAARVYQVTARHPHPPAPVFFSYALADMKRKLERLHEPVRLEIDATTPVRHPPNGCACGCNDGTAGEVARHRDQTVRRLDTGEVVVIPAVQGWKGETDTTGAWVGARRAKGRR